MARDLIPPPSPGRPAAARRHAAASPSMPRLVELPPEPHALAPLRARRRRAELPPSRVPQPLRLHARRARRLLVASALVLAVVLRPRQRPGGRGASRKNWSKWQPTDTSRPARRRSPTHVGPSTSTPTGAAGQVISGPLEIDVALRRAMGPHQRSSAARAMLYKLNGLGPTARSRAARRRRTATGSFAARRWSSRCTRSATCPTSTWCVTLLPPPQPADGRRRPHSERPG